MSLDPVLVVRAYPRDLWPQGPLVPVLGAAGASGARLWRYPSALGPQALRAWPPAPDVSKPALLVIHQWLFELRGIPQIPLPWRGRDGQTLQGEQQSWWELAPWKPGKPDLGRPPSDDHVRQAFATLGRLHAILSRHAERAPSPGLARREAELDQAIQGGYAWALNRIPPTDLSEEAALARSWLHQATRLAPSVKIQLAEARGSLGRLQPCLRDTRPEHFLFLLGQLSGLVDFGAMGMEWVSADLARLLADWIGPDLRLRQVALDAYLQSNPGATAELRSIPAFEESQAVLGGLRWIRWHWIEHRLFEPGTVPTGLRRSLDRLTTLETLHALRAGPSAIQATT